MRATTPLTDSLRSCTSHPGDSECLQTCAHCVQRCPNLLYPPMFPEGFETVKCSTCHLHSRCGVSCVKDLDWLLKRQIQCPRCGSEEVHEVECSICKETHLPNFSVKLQECFPGRLTAHLYLSCGIQSCITTGPEFLARSWLCRQRGKSRPAKDKEKEIKQTKETKDGDKTENERERRQRWLLAEIGKVVPSLTKEQGQRRDQEYANVLEFFKNEAKAQSKDQTKAKETYPEIQSVQARFLAREEDIQFICDLTKIIDMASASPPELNLRPEALVLVSVLRAQVASELVFLRWCLKDWTSGCFHEWIPRGSERIRRCCTGLEFRSGWNAAKWFEERGQVGDEEATGVRLYLASDAYLWARKEFRDFSKDYYQLCSGTVGLLLCSLEPVPVSPVSPSRILFASASAAPIRGQWSTLFRKAVVEGFYVIHGFHVTFGTEGSRRTELQLSTPDVVESWSERQKRLDKERLEQKAQEAVYKLQNQGNELILVEEQGFTRPVVWSKNPLAVGLAGEKPRPGGSDSDGVRTDFWDEFENLNLAL